MTRWEIWQKRHSYNTSAPWEWMVYDYEKMDTRWFMSEQEARDYIAATQLGTDTREDDDAPLQA